MCLEMGVTFGSMDRRSLALQNDAGNLGDLKSLFINALPF